MNLTLKQCKEIFPEKKFAVVNKKGIPLELCENKDTAREVIKTMRINSPFLQIVEI